MSSLQHQLRRQWLMSLLAITLPLLLLVDLGVRQLTQHYVLNRLDHDADSLIAAIEVGPDGRWQVNEQRLGSLFQRVYSGHYYAIHSADGQMQLSRSLWDRQPPDFDQHFELTPGQQRSWQQNGALGDQVWLNLARQLEIDGQSFSLWVAEDISDLQATLNRYRLLALLLLAAAVTLLLLWQRRQLQQVFAQLRPLQRHLQQLQQGERQDLTDVRTSYPQEIQPLAAELDHLLQRLQQRIQRSRNALGNLAHTMKHPLQQLQLLAEQLSPDQQAEQVQALRQLQQLTERELQRARIVGMPSPGRQTQLDDELPALQHILQQLYPQAELRFAYAPGLVMPHDRDDMLELLGNLLDNACKYGAGKDGTRQVQLSVGLSNEKGAEWQLDVRDQGDGIAAQQRDYLLQRGTRLDEHGEHLGSGLGLAMVVDIVASYGGRLQLLDNEPHGLHVSVTLPALSDRE